MKLPKVVQLLMDNYDMDPLYKVESTYQKALLCKTRNDGSNTKPTTNNLQMNDNLSTLDFPLIRRAYRPAGVLLPCMTMSNLP